MEEMTLEMLNLFSFSDITNLFFGNMSYFIKSDISIALDVFAHM
jgi:hypothetical protein